MRMKTFVKKDVSKKVIVGEFGKTNYFHRWLHQNNVPAFGLRIIELKDCFILDYGLGLWGNIYI